MLSKIFDEFDNVNAMGRKSAGKTQGQPLIVAHRPVKRKLIGFFHKEDLWGEVDEARGLFRIRCNAESLKAKMLRLPEAESDYQVIERLALNFRKTGSSEKDARKQARECVKNKQFTRKLVDPAPGVSGLVRDHGLRRVIRECLGTAGIDPDRFTDKQIKEFVNAGKLKMPSGVPIKSAVVVGPIDDPVRIAVRDPYTGIQAINSRTGKPLFRFHFSRSNHHIEILEDESTSTWSGEVIRTIDAAARVRRKKLPAVNRSNRDGKCFVMSLAIGETLWMRHPRTNEPGFFVVFKIDPDGAVHFTHHWDARPSSASEGQQAREDVDLVPSKLRNLGVDLDTAPVKVRIDPLGKFRKSRWD